MKKKRKHGRRKHRRNPSSHPILAALATLIGESAIGAVTFYALKRMGAGLGIAASVASLGSAVGGYAVGVKYWPKSKTPILVGSVLHLLFSGIGYSLSNAVGALKAGSAVQVPILIDASGRPYADASGVLMPGVLSDPPVAAGGALRVDLHNVDTGAGVKIVLTTITAPPSLVHVMALEQAHA